MKLLTSVLASSTCLWFTQAACVFPYLCVQAVEQLTGMGFLEPVVRKVSFGLLFYAVVFKSFHMVELPVN